MPTLLLFVPCEKAIIDQHGTLTIIALVENLEVEINEGASLPSNAVAPKEWAIVALWKPTESEGEASFRQVVELTKPDGQPYKKVLHEFSFSGNKQHRIVHQVVGMPVGLPGVYPLRMWLEKHEAMVCGPFTYNLTVTHKTAPAK